MLIPRWPAPASVRACVTTRIDGSRDGARDEYQERPYEHFNIADHVGDDPVNVANNRALLAAQCGLHADDIVWLQQVHGTSVADLDQPVGGKLQADGATTQTQHRACVVMTADCLPVLLCDQRGTRIAAVHAGWRGLCAGIIERAVAYFERPSDVLAWMGPAIGPKVFEVGEDVRRAFCECDDQDGTAFYALAETDKYLADIYFLARKRLQRLGVQQIFGGDYCTVSEPERFYSYRRDGQHTGRMASLIWLTPSSVA